MYILGSITCVIALIYFYGNFLSIKRMEVRNLLEYRQFIVNLDQNISFDEIQNDFLEPYKVERVLLTGETTIDASYQDKFDSSLTRSDNQSGFPMKISADLHAGSRVVATLGRTSFTEEENQSDSPLVVLPNDYLGELGDEIQVEGQNCKIIGLSTDSDKMYIPLGLYEKLHVPTGRIVITLVNQLSPADVRALSDKINQAYPHALIQTPLDYTDLAYSKLPAQLLLICLLYLVALLSFLFLFKYLIDQSRFENTIYSIVGASKRQILSVLVTETVLLSSISAIFGILIHCIFYASVFAKINALGNIPYHFLDYLLIFVLIVLMAGITIIPFLIHFYRNTAIESKNMYGQV